MQFINMTVEFAAFKCNQTDILSFEDIMLILVYIAAFQIKWLGWLAGWLTEWLSKPRWMDNIKSINVAAHRALFAIRQSMMKEFILYAVNIQEG